MLQMKPLPYPIRIAAGLVATVVEQARDLPRLVVEFPVTAVSQALQASMRVQQRVTELAIKGDRALGSLRPVEEKPSWATFDDEEEEPPRNGSSAVTELRRPGAERIPVAQPPTADRPSARPGAGSPAARRSVAEPIPVPRPAAERIPVARPAASEPEPTPALPDGDGPAVLPGYPEMSIPQLRARLRNLNIDDLKALLDWENDHGARTLYVTMLTNRIITVTEG